MCGIVGAISQRDVVPKLLSGLKRLEYRGYDSAGIAVIDNDGSFQRYRVAGKVNDLQQLVDKSYLNGKIGIAHTRWATHGQPSEDNAHPHISGDYVALVHNGIIENHIELRNDLKRLGYEFKSDTDSEVVVAKIHQQLANSTNLLEAVQKATSTLVGTYAISIVSRSQPNCLIAARRGSPLVIGIGKSEYFTASDTFALAALTSDVMYLDDGDVVELKLDGIRIFDSEGNQTEHAISKTLLQENSLDKQNYKHYMLKEIFEQASAIGNMLEGRISNSGLIDTAFGLNAESIFRKTKDVQIIACGTSYHAGLVARYWFESLTGIRCHVDYASEYRYREPYVSPNTLIVTISQSGETADTIAALEEAKRHSIAGTLVICNVPESALVRASDLVFMTRAGPEIGVASTKAFTTQLSALLLLIIALGRKHTMKPQMEAAIVKQLHTLPKKIEQVLSLAPQIQTLAQRFVGKEHVLFLGRGFHYPIALEGALKLKEISYIHAEAYPAGELKHGPLALVDQNMLIVAVAPHNTLLEKLKSNFEEVRSRGGQLIVFADENSKMSSEIDKNVILLPATEKIISPIVFTVPLQLLAYYVANFKGTDIDQPRNLAKSVTVE